MEDISMTDETWVPSACALPTVDQPLRVAEFDDLFANDVLGVEETPRGIRLKLRPAPDVVARAAGLAARETGCCSFFTFELTITEGRTEMIVSAEPSHRQVLA